MVPDKMKSQQWHDGDVILEDLVLQGAGLLSRKEAQLRRQRLTRMITGAAALSVLPKLWSNGCLMEEKKLHGVFRLHFLIDIYSSSLIILLLTMKHVNFARSCLRIT
ncbi:unnamed protein product [Urochloa humidicola]